MKKVVRLTESDLLRIINKVINESTSSPICDSFIYIGSVSLPKQGGGFEPYVADKTQMHDDSVYTDPKSGGKFGSVNATGREVWLNSGGFDGWPKGNDTLAYNAAKKLYDGVMGLDFSGEGAKKITEFSEMWKKLDLPTQNEFLKQWYKMTESDETPWEAIDNDYEGHLIDGMVNDSISKIKSFCKVK